MRSNSYLFRYDRYSLDVALLVSIIINNIVEYKKMYIVFDASLYESQKKIGFGLLPFTLYS